MSASGPKSDQSRYIVNSVDTALKVLELVARLPGRTLAELAKSAELNKSRTMRFLVTLESHGYVRRDNIGGYYLATRAIVLGDQAREQVNHIALLQPILDRLRDKTGETIQYRVLDGLRTVCLAMAESKLDIRVHANTGRPRELYIGSSKSILAFGSSTLLDAVLESPITSFTRKTVVDPDELKKQLAEIRSRGYSISKSERIEGALAIGAPIFNQDRSVTRCLSLLGPEFRIKSKIDKFGSTLMEAAKEVEHFTIDG